MGLDNAQNNGLNQENLLHVTAWVNIPAISATTVAIGLADHYVAIYKLLMSSGDTGFPVVLRPIGGTNLIYPNLHYPGVVYIDFGLTPIIGDVISVNLEFYNYAAVAKNLSYHIWYKHTI